MIYGYAGRKIDLKSGVLAKKEIITFNLFQIVGNAVVWGLLAPTLDILIYAEPASKVFTQGIVSGVLNMIAVAIIGTLLMKAYAATQVQAGSLKKD